MTPPIQEQIGTVLGRSKKKKKKKRKKKKKKKRGKKKKNKKKKDYWWEGRGRLKPVLPCFNSDLAPGCSYMFGPHRGSTSLMKHHNHL